MPLYSYKCDFCDIEFERVLPLKLYDVPQIHVCGRFATKQLTVVRVMGDLPEYDSPIDGRPIRGRKERLEDLKRNRCRPYETGEKEEMLRRRAAEDRKFDAAVEETVERGIAKMTPRQRESLQAEVDHGLDVKVTREREFAPPQPIRIKQ